MTFKVFSGADGTTFEIKVQAGANKTAITGIWENAIKLKVAKKPEAGAANKECLKYLARRLNIPVQALRIIKGEFSRRKVIQVKGLSAAVVRAKLLPAE